MSGGISAPTVISVAVNFPSTTITFTVAEERATSALGRGRGFDTFLHPIVVGVSSESAKLADTALL